MPMRIPLERLRPPPSGPRASRCRAPALLVLGLLALAGPVAAQEGAREPAPRPGEPAALPGEPVTSGSLGSPRAALTRYLEAMREGRLAEALPVLGSHVPGDPARTAWRLKAVLDTHLWFDLDTISDHPAGRLDDGLAPEVEELGRIPVRSGSEAVEMVRLPSGEWVFSPATLARVDRWYRTVPHRWIREHLPEPLLRPGPHELLWWQWLALPLFAILCLVAGRLLAAGISRALRSATRRTSTPYDDALVLRLSGPLVLVSALIAAFVLLPVLALTAPARAFVGSGLHAFVLVALFWAMLRVVDVVAEMIAASPFAASRPETIALLPLASRVAKLGVLAIAAVTVLQKLGYPVASLIAGLGIGGLAVALAAQKTVENLFGSVTLTVDQPFRPGDFVKVEDVLGTVEAVGLRSTRIRTLDRTLVTLPNGRLADMRIESYAARDRLRLFAVLGLVYSTRPEQVRRIVREIEDLLRAHPRVWPDVVRVTFSGFGASSLDVEVLAWFQLTDWGEFTYLRQDVLLQIMEIVQRNGSSFAFPTRTVHLAREEPAPTAS